MLKKMKLTWLYHNQLKSQDLLLCCSKMMTRRMIRTAINQSRLRLQPRRKRRRIRIKTRTRTILNKINKIVKLRNKYHPWKNNYLLKKLNVWLKRRNRNKRPRNKLKRRLRDCKSSRKNPKKSMTTNSWIKYCRRVFKKMRNMLHLICLTMVHLCSEWRRVILITRKNWNNCFRRVLWNLESPHWLRKPRRTDRLNKLTGMNSMKVLPRRWRDECSCMRRCNRNLKLLFLRSRYLLNQMHSGLVWTDCLTWSKLELIRRLVWRYSHLRKLQSIIVCRRNSCRFKPQPILICLYSSYREISTIMKV